MGSQIRELTARLGHTRTGGANHRFARAVAQAVLSDGLFSFAPQSFAGSDVMGRNNQEPRDLHVRVCRNNSRLTKIRNGLFM
jgi:hypothetical protein